MCHQGKNYIYAGGTVAQMTLSVHFVWFWSLHMCWNLVWNTCNAHVNKYVNRIAEFRVQYKQLSESDIGMDSFWKMKMSANWRKRTYCSEQSHVWDKKKEKKSPGKQAQILWVLCRWDTEYGLPLMFGQAGQKRFCHSFIERRVSSGLQLSAGVFHTGTRQGHVIATCCREKMRETLFEYLFVSSLMWVSVVLWLTGLHTGRTEAQGTGSAQTSACNACDYGWLLLPQTRLLLSGRDH